MIISISGKPGAGKSTIAKILAEKLKLKNYYMGGIIRNMAKEKGITLQEFYAKSTDVDKLIDDHLTKLGKEQDNFIVESRTAFHFIPHSVKIYLDIDLEEGAKRIFKESQKENERNEKKYKDVEETKDWIEKRLETEKEHYGTLYNFDAHDKNHFDYILDTTDLTLEEVQEKLINFLTQYNK